MKRSAAETLRILSCLAEPSRFHLTRLLTRGAGCVTELAGAVGLSQSCTTRHLQVLGQVGVVSARREGRRVMYRLRLDHAGVGPLLDWALTGETAVGATGREFGSSQAHRDRPRERDAHAPDAPARGQAASGVAVARAGAHLEPPALELADAERRGPPSEA